MNPRVISQPIGAGQLAAAAMSGTAPRGWYEAVPRDVDGWRERVDAIRSDFNPKWLDGVVPAIEPTSAAAERLRRAANGHGVVVTTGQQPGLFGGPVYTLSKALTALAFANALEEATGVPVAPVFWAATDDTDFREASTTVISRIGGPQLLRADHPEPLGRPMSAMPLGDVDEELRALIESAGSVIDDEPLELLRQFYNAKESVGSAYVGLLRALFAPLGISVIDASHAATRSASADVLRAALEHSVEIAEAVAVRGQDIQNAGFDLQVQDMPGLSLVFSTSSGSRKRIPIKAARKIALSDEMGPNVLLRPIVERAILPTAAYLGGPAEIAYFAQLGPVAEVIGAKRPLIVPRWSCTIIEPHVERILKKLDIQPEDLREAHKAESRVARRFIPASVLTELETTRADINERLDSLASTVQRDGAPVNESVVVGLRANLARRLDRFERRLIAAAKKEQTELMKEIATARGSLFPFGKPQERALNFVPFLARYGPALRDTMLSEAATHAARLIGTHSSAKTREPATTAARER